MWMLVSPSHTPTSEGVETKWQNQSCKDAFAFLGPSHTPTSEGIEAESRGPEPKGQNNSDVLYISARLGLGWAQEMVC